MTDPATWGPNLYAYLDAHWQATGTNANAWGYTHGVQGPNLTRWRGGTPPSLQMMATVAKALNMSLLDVLLIAGAVTQDDIARPVPEPATTSIDAAIEADPSLSDWQRKNLREILASFRAVEAGVQSVEVRPTKRSK